MSSQTDIRRSTVAASIWLAAKILCQAQMPCRSKPAEIASETIGAGIVAGCLLRKSELLEHQSKLLVSCSRRGCIVLLIFARQGLNCRSQLVRNSAPSGIARYQELGSVFSSDSNQDFLV